MIPGRRVDVTVSGQAIHPQAIAGVDDEPGAVEADALVLCHHPLIGFDTLAPPFLADLGAAHRRRLRRARLRGSRARVHRGAQLRQPAARSVGGRRGGAVHGVLRRGGGSRRRPRRRRPAIASWACPARRPAATGTSPTAAGWRASARARDTSPDGRARRRPRSAGSGFGGAIAAFRLAEAYRAAGADPRAILVARARQARSGTRTSSSRCTSNIFLPCTNSSRARARRWSSRTRSAAAPTSTWRRRCARRARRSSAATAIPATGRSGACGPTAISRATLNPYYARAEAGLRVRRPTWSQVSRSGGVWAATLDKSGHTCDRVPLAISPERCVDAKWCHTGCVFGAKNSADHELPGARARARGAACARCARSSPCASRRRGRTATSRPCR